MKVVSLIACSTLLLGVTNVAAKVKSTIDLDALPKKGETVVWTPLFQAAWEDLNKAFGGKPYKVSPVNKLTAKLDLYQWERKAVMPEGAYKIYAGPSTPEFLKQSAGDAKKRFNMDLHTSRIPHEEDGKVCFGVLSRELKFKTPFHRSKIRPLIFVSRDQKKHSVKFFGTGGSQSEKFKDDVKVVSYKDKGKKFLLSIKTKTPEERVMIYRPGKLLSMGQAIKEVKAQLKSPLNGPYASLTDGSIHEKDVIKIPYISCKADTDFSSQLGGLRYVKGNKNPWFVHVAYQIAEFELHEKGAKVKVESGISGVFGEEPKKINYVKRRFICDRPFFVFLWKDGADAPYLAIWIDGDKTLKKF